MERVRRTLAAFARVGRVALKRKRRLVVCIVVVGEGRRVGWRLVAGGFGVKR